MGKGIVNLSYIEVMVIDEAGKVVYAEQVQETVEEPNYKAALEALMDA